MAYGSSKKSAHTASVGISAYDLPTQDKIPVIEKLMPSDYRGLALDIGSGTGYTTYLVFGDRPTVCVDLYAPNLQYHRNRIASLSLARQPLCIVARATALPFKPGVFRVILCSEVLEHLEDDDAAAKELAWVLASDGRAVVTVPHSKWGFASFLELCRIKTVHDFPGPERHFRVGYTKESLARVLRRHGLQIEESCYYLRFFTRIATDLVSLGHLLFQKIVHRRNVWNWSDVTKLEDNLVFRIYTRIFPMLWVFSRLDRLFLWAPGFGLVAAIKKSQTEK